MELGKLQGGKKMQGWREEALLMRDLIDEHLVPRSVCVCERACILCVPLCPSV